jgi:uncharacterized protein (TIGR03437 family)
LLSVPASIMVAAGATSAAFPVTAGTISGNQTATVTATYGGTSQATVISLGTPPSGGTGTISSVNCLPAFVPTGSTATCTINLSSTASSAATASVSTDNPAAVTIPTQVSIAAGAISASFPVTAALTAAGQSANLFVVLNGTMQSSSISIIASAALTSLACTPNALNSGGATTCTVTLSGAALAGGAVVTLASSTALLLVPASVTVPAGATSATFTATAGAVSGTTQPAAILTATLNGVSQTASLALSMVPGSVSSLTCSPDPTASGTLLCTVQLASAAPAGGSNIQLQAASSGVQLPTQVQVPAGAQSVQFRATVLISDQDQQVNISAAANAGAPTSLALSVTGIRPTSVVCPSSLPAGGAVTCVVRLSATNVPAVARLTVATTSSNLKIPLSITTRPRQTRLTFVVQSDPLAPQQSASVSVQFGSSTVSSPLAVQQAGAPILTVPATQAVVAGNPLRVMVSAADPGGLPVTLAAANLPDGASFDPTAGVLSWTPAAAQLGTYTVTFAATNSASASSSGQLIVYVDSGQPVITDLRNAASQRQPACSSGAVASVVGRWLAAVTQPAADLTGGSTTLAGSQVLVNGTAVPVLAVSAGRIDFLCPALPAGTLLNVAVQNTAGASSPAQTTMQDVSVGVFANDNSGQGQGTVVLAGTSLLATSRTFQNLGQPAQPGDAVTIRVTGMGDAGNALPMVKIADLYARADALNPVPGLAGVFDLTVTVPPGVAESGAVPVSVVSPMPASAGACARGVLAPGTWPSAPSGSCSSAAHPGDEALSNTVNIAVELGY